MAKNPLSLEQTMDQLPAYASIKDMLVAIRQAKIGNLREVAEKTLSMAPHHEPGATVTIERARSLEASVAARLYWGHCEHDAVGRYLNILNLSDEYKERLFNECKKRRKKRMKSTVYVGDATRISLDQAFDANLNYWGLDRNDPRLKQAAASGKMEEWVAAIGNIIGARDFDAAEFYAIAESQMLAQKDPGLFTELIDKPPPTREGRR